MTWKRELRLNEVSVEWPARVDATLTFVGVIRTPWAILSECPHSGQADGPICRIEVFDPWVPALDGIEAFEQIEVLYWLHFSRRDLVRQSPSRDGKTKATFTIRSPVRPNPIGVSVARLVRRDANVLLARGLDCVDGTPLLDLKPERGQFRRAPHP